MKKRLTILAAAVLMAGHAPGQKPDAKAAPADIFRQFQIPQWFKDAKFGLWLHWGPQSIPEKGGGWYARHCYAHGEDLTEGWGGDAWYYHREKFGHQSEFGYKDIINLWKAEKFDANATLKQFKQWGARYAAIMAQHHDNYDLFYTPVHQWNAVNVGPRRDILGEFAAAARKHGLRWAATSHGYWASWWYKPAFSSDKEGEKKGVPYDGNLTKADGKGKWWDGLDPQQLYAHKYPDFEKELGQRLLYLVENYKPDILYFDNGDIPAPAVAACEQLYRQSMDKKGRIQAVVTVKKPQTGTVRDFEKGIADGIQDDDWQTDTSLDGAWFLKPLDEEAGTEKSSASGNLRHNARTLEELFVDIISKRGVLLLNLPIFPDGSIPREQMDIMNEFGDWINAHSEAIFATIPWKIYGKGGKTAGGHFNERTVAAQPWNEEVYRFTCSKDGKTLYVHIFGHPAGKEITIGELADKTLFGGKVEKVLMVSTNKPVAWEMKPAGLSVKMPDKLGFPHCNVLKIKINN
jgi:alpha-L-fucosidase